MVKLKIISSNPSTLAITLRCISSYALKKVNTHSKQFFDGLGIGFIDHKHNHMIAGLNNRIVVCNQYFIIAYQSGQRGRRGGDLISPMARPTTFELFSSP